MPKRRTRITPKVRKRAKRSSQSPSEGRDSKNEEIQSSQESEEVVSSAASDRQDNEIDRVESKSSRKRSSRAKNQSQAPAEIKTRKTSRSSKQETQASAVNIPRKTRTSSRSGAAQAKVTDTVSERIRDLRVAKATYDKWQALSSPSKDYIKQILGSSIPNIINTVSDEEEREAVQQYLTALNERVFTKLDLLRGPKNDGQYRKNEAQCRSLEEDLTSSKTQLTVLEKELEEQKKLLEEEEDKLDVYTNQLIPSHYDMDHDKLHPFLRVESVDTLHLPKLPAESLSKPVLQFPTNVAQQGAKELAQTLSCLDEQMIQLGPVKQWLHTVSVLHNSLCNRPDA